MNFTFTTRDEYFQYKADWKRRYFALILQIRASALAVRESQRAFSKTGAWPPKARGQWEHTRLKAQATALLAQRCDSKREAARQRALQITKAA